MLLGTNSLASGFKIVVFLEAGTTTTGDMTGALTVGAFLRIPWLGVAMRGFIGFRAGWSCDRGPQTDLSGRLNVTVGCGERFEASGIPICSTDGVAGFAASFEAKEPSKSSIRGAPFGFGGGGTSGFNCRDHRWWYFPPAANSSSWPPFSTIWPSLMTMMRSAFMMVERR
jgi:hypothetical protein